MKNQNFSFTPLGGGMEIGANSFYFEWDDVHFLIDAGSNPQTMGWFAVPSLFRINRLDFVLITHAHQDHIGSLPYLTKLFPEMKIYMTANTYELAQKMLYDSVKFQRIAKKTGAPLFNNYDVNVCLDNVEIIEEDFELNGVKIHSFSSGHILGSVGFVLEKNKEKIVFTSDIALENKKTSEPVNLPDIKADLVISESTYGRDTEEGKYLPRKEEFQNIIQKIKGILENGGSILFPAFVIERAQEIAIIINEAMANGEIKNVPVYIGGLGIPISQIHMDSLDITLDYDELNYEMFDDGSITSEQAIYITGAGMLSNGSTASRIASQLIKDPKNAVIFTGYCSPESPGFHLIHNKGVIFLNYRVEKVETKHIYQYHLSCHSPGYELIKIIDSFKPEQVILTHGDNEAIANMRKALENKDYKNIISPKNDETIFLNNKYQIVDLNPTALENYYEMENAFYNGDEGKFEQYFEMNMVNEPWDLASMKFYIENIYLSPNDPIIDKYEKIFKILLKDAYENGNFEKVFKVINLWNINYTDKISKKFKEKVRKIKRKMKKYENNNTQN